MPKLGNLAAILEGLDSAAGDIGTGYFSSQLMKEELEKKKREEQLLNDTLQEFQETQNKPVIDRSIDWVVKSVGDKFGIQISNYKNLSQKALNEQILIDSFLKKNDLPKNKESRKDAKNYLKSLGPQEVSKEFDLETGVSKEQGNKKESFEESHPTLNSFKELLTRNPLDPQTYKDMGSVVAKTPSRLGKHLLNLLGNVDQKRRDSLAKQGMIAQSSSLAEELAPSIDKLGKYEQGVDKLLGSNPDHKSREAEEMIFDTLALPGSKLAKGGSKLTRLGKNAMKGAGSGAALSALYSEGDPDSIKMGAILGGGIHAVSGAKTPKSKQANLYRKIAEDADDITLEQAKARAKVLGEDALIPEIVGSESYINRLKQDPSKYNKQRQRNMQKGLKQTGQDLESELIRGDKETLYENLHELKHGEHGVMNSKNRLYDLAKGEGLLAPNELNAFYSAVAEADPYTKGLPQFKPRKGNVSSKYLKGVKDTISQAPEKERYGKHYEKQYEQWFSKNEKSLPTVEDFIEYKSRVRKKLEGDPGNNGLINLKNALDKIVENTEAGSHLKKANKYYATHAAPFTKKNIESAIDSVKFKEPESAPSMFDTFGKHSPENSKVFRQMTPTDKKRVIGSMLDEIIGDTGMRPDRAIMKLWDKLPEYMKQTNDSSLREIFKEMRTLANMNKTLSSIQQSTTESIGTRQNVGKVQSILSKMGYAISTANGPKSLGIFSAANALSKGAQRYKNSSFRKPLNQKNLKHYFNPELLDEMIKQKKLKHQNRLPIKLLSRSKESDDEL